MRHSAEFSDRCPPPLDDQRALMALAFMSLFERRPTALILSAIVQSGLGQLKTSDSKTTLTLFGIRATVAAQDGAEQLLRQWTCAAQDRVELGAQA